MLDRILGSRVRAELLRVLFSQAGRRVHLHELARLTGISAPSLMREAKLLTRDGLLTSQCEANRTLYSANQASAFYRPIVDLVSCATDPILLMQSQLAVPSVRLAFVYGSRAKGTARQNSDYDLFVVGEIGLRQLSALLSPVREKVGVEINPYIVTAKEFVMRVQARDHFICDVLSSKKVFLKGGDDELAAVAG